VLGLEGRKKKGRSVWYCEKKDGEGGQMVFRVDNTMHGRPRTKIKGEELWGRGRFSRRTGRSQCFVLSP